ncbi:MAG: peptidase M28, partial [Bacteroidales bacterium]|nr:peptidase M28 [Bacteroidales bacterium]
MRKILISLLAIAAGLMLSSRPVAAQDKVVNKVLEYGRSDNRTMQHADFLSNVIGGRIVGSAALTEAEAWAKEQFESWGLEVMVQEVGQINVGFNRGPWFGRMLSDDGMVLHFGTPSYTAGTKGRQSGHVVLEPLTRRELEKMKAT